MWTKARASRKGGYSPAVRIAFFSYPSQSAMETHPGSVSPNIAAASAFFLYLKNGVLDGRKEEGGGRGEEVEGFLY